ncbi:MAG: glycosyltransferase family 2 protein [Methanoregula sp.]|jgi:dolichol-phosphate mannosyltransferase|uniref:GtrA family protein n=1 Tax=Methanoregula sp. TaxID=2052170 RepID=UPI0025D2744C|nr:glycosyltransferase family 2 protein [Methanoregula sp.]MCK9631610.1 glycosyltransferase family 2 protein [Methanoregula sp.]
MYDLTVIIPTFKEEANIRNIITEVDAVFQKNTLNGEILVVDDDSPDNTIVIVNELKKTMANVDLLVRTTDHGLSQSVADGFLHASSDVFVVIDADMSHPPALIPKMYEEIRAGCDVVIGSRYMEGGGIKKWPLKRRIISLGATFLGRLLFPDITDPVSGFFAVRRSVVAEAKLKPRGYKILLEVLGKGTWENDKEIPFEFSDREIGTSKLKIRTIIEYAEQVADITLYSFTHHQSAAWREWKKVFKFGIVGISGIIVNLGILFLLVEYTCLNEYTDNFIAIAIAGAVAIEISILNNFIWNDLWTFHSQENRKYSSRWHRLVAFNIVSAGGAAINWGVLLILTGSFGFYYMAAQFIGTLIGFIWNFTVNRRFTWGRTSE